MGNISLVRVGAVCAILGVVSGIMARTLFAVRPVPSLWFSAVGSALIGIGVLLFSFDILRTSVVPKWIDPHPLRVSRHGHAIGPILRSCGGWREGPFEPQTCLPAG